MAWYWWIVGLAVVFTAITAGSVAVLLATSRGRRFVALSTRGKVSFGRDLASREGVPWYAKAIVAVVLGYLALPIDLIPDFIPILGQVDDIAVVAAGTVLLLFAVPRAAFEAAIAQAEAADAARAAERASRRAG